MGSILDVDLDQILPIGTQLGVWGIGGITVEDGETTIRSAVDKVWERYVYHSERTKTGREKRNGEGLIFVQKMVLADKEDEESVVEVRLVI